MVAQRSSSALLVVDGAGTLSEAIVRPFVDEIYPAPNPQPLKHAQRRFIRRQFSMRPFDRTRFIRRHSFARKKFVRRPFFCLKVNSYPHVQFYAQNVTPTGTRDQGC